MKWLIKFNVIIYFSEVILMNFSFYHILSVVSHLLIFYFTDFSLLLVFYCNFNNILSCVKNKRVVRPNFTCKTKEGKKGDANLRTPSIGHLKSQSSHSYVPAGITHQSVPNHAVDHQLRWITFNLSAAA